MKIAKDTDLISVNEAFMAHRQHCALCGGNGPGVCQTGMELLRMFHAGLVAAVAQELLRATA